MNRMLTLSFAVAGTLAAAACNTSDVEVEGAGQSPPNEFVIDAELPDGDSSDDDGMDHEGHEGHGGHMDAADKDATPAYDVTDAQLFSGDFVELDSAPEGFVGADGTAWMAVNETGTTVTVEVSGLALRTKFISHLHADGCDQAGGPHFQFDPDGGDVPPNEIHLNFTTDGDGTGSVTVTNDSVVEDDSVSVVVHAADGDTTKALCADLASE